MAVNRVVGGDYAGKMITESLLVPCIYLSGLLKQKKVALDKANVKGWKVLDLAQAKSSGLGRAVLGGVMLGGAGAVVGAVTGKGKIKNKSITIGVQFVDGRKSIIEVDNQVFSYFKRKLTELEINDKFNSFLNEK